jgi:hypothetical protein
MNQKRELDEENSATKGQLQQDCAEPATIQDIQAGGSEKTECFLVSTCIERQLVIETLPTVPTVATLSDRVIQLHRTKLISTLLSRVPLAWYFTLSTM